MPLKSHLNKDLNLPMSQYNASDPTRSGRCTPSSKEGISHVNSKKCLYTDRDTSTTATLLEQRRVAQEETKHAIIVLNESTDGTALVEKDDLGVGEPVHQQH